ncbi:cytochrome P450 [Paraphoma chrysanthemicola]|uniref:Cytochrome P450 n=1 Tax=Paraphoma chrysanthemicola TaxID=798071 RepID=A0A8K0R203_9PLEO|nr:cytochrome P450 [Paraphoma chrysanthemicola]
MVFALLAVNHLILFTYISVIYPCFLSPLRRLARPKWYLLRIIQSRFIRRETQGQLLLEVAEETQNNGILRLGEIFNERLLLTDIHLISDLLVQHPYDFMKPDNTRDFMRHFLGDGLIIIEGERHKLLRKNTLKAFGFRQIRDLYPIMWTKAMALASTIGNTIGNKNDGCRLEMNDWASKVTLDVIGIAGLGHDFNLLANAEDALVKSYEAVTGDHMLLYFLMSMWLSFDFVKALPWKKNRIFMENTAQMKSICQRLIQEKRDVLSHNLHDHPDLLSQLIQTDSFTNEELADQLLTILVAGHDTTSASLTWACHLLTQHPEWKQALQKEIRDADLPSSTEALTNESAESLARRLENLPVLNGVLQETLRLYPTVPVTNRVAVCNTTLGTQFIPKGTEILISPWVINRSSALWSADGRKASDFDPQRWIDEKGRPNNHGGADTNYAIQTFLHGPRSCLGQGFTKAELRCLLAIMALHFDWELAMEARDVIPAGAITIRPLNGLYLQVNRAGIPKNI